MTDSRIIIIGLLAVCIIVLFKPPTDPTTRETLALILGGVIGHLVHAPTKETKPDGNNGDAEQPPTVP